MMDDDGCPQSEKNTHRMCISGLRTSVYSDTLNRVRRQAYSVSLSTK